MTRVDIQDSLSVLRQAFKEADEYHKNEYEKFWNSLSEEDQLKAFCAVTRRIHQGELVDRGSYRHVLYSVFGFGPESYSMAMLAGYLDIHNAIVVGDENE